MTRAVEPPEMPLLWSERRRMIMADSDSAGVLYYGAPFPWHEHALLEWLASTGHRISDILAEGNAFPCVHAEADYLAPLRVDDLIDVRLHAGSTGNSSFRLETRIWHESQLAGAVRATYVWAAGQPLTGVRSEPLPDWLRRALQAPGPDIAHEA